MVLGIDAANIRGGGGVTHLVELLGAADPRSSGFSRVVVWGGRRTLDQLPALSWLDRANVSVLDKGLLRRVAWQCSNLAREARRAGCHVLFVPGGAYCGNFRPVVTLSQNMLPFEFRELRRYGWSPRMWQLLLLRFAQGWAFRRADGVIFLTQYARRRILEVVGNPSGPTRVIPHGVDQRFVGPLRRQRDIAEYSPERPFRITYVSIVDLYKHQWHVVEAVAELRRRGWPVALDLIGPAYPPALRRLEATLDRVDPRREWACYRGAEPYKTVHRRYQQSELGVFASSCENLPIILLEAMAAGLPLACSNRGPMPEVIGMDMPLFDPEKPDELTALLEELILRPARRKEVSEKAQERMRAYNWDECAMETFDFLREIGQRSSGAHSSAGA